MASKKPAAKPAAKPSKPASSGGAKAKGTEKKKVDWHQQHSHLFKKSPKNFQQKKDLSRFVKWPAYIRLQRQKSILQRRLKVPPAINQFSKAVTGTQAKELFRLLKAYRPESKLEKKKRLTEKAAQEAKQEGSSSADKKPIVLKFGLNHVTHLIESKKAKLVVIAHDVAPLELVVWLPALCRRFDIPYCIVKGKARLGHLVYKKTSAVVALTDVRKEHAQTLTTLVQTLRIQFNDNVSVRSEWGGGIMGNKFQAAQRKQAKAAGKKLAAK